MRKLVKRAFAVCMCFTLLCVFTGNALAAEERPEPLPAESDTTLGDIQRHFNPEVYEKMPEEMKEEVDAARMEALERKSVSVNKVVGGFALASVAFLTYACASGKSDDNSEGKSKKKGKSRRKRDKS